MATQNLIQFASNWTVEILQPGTANSQIRTHCASIRITNTSKTKVLYLAPAASSYRLPVAPGSTWGIDLADVRDELDTIINVFTAAHDADVIVERITKHLA